MPLHSVFLSFAYTGHDAAAVTARMRRLVDICTAHDVTAYCNLFDPATKGLKTPKQFMTAALHDLHRHPAAVFIFTDGGISEGMCIELGAALALGKPTIALVSSDATYHYAPTLTDTVLSWSNDIELNGALEQALHLLRTQYVTPT